MSAIWFFIALSATEIVILGFIVAFISRLKKSERLISALQANQEALLQRLSFNAQLEDELVRSFERRQQELKELDQRLEARSRELRSQLAEAERMVRSPRFLREAILAGHGRGQSSEAIARALNLTVDEVELIIEQAKS